MSLRYLGRTWFRRKWRGLGGGFGLVWLSLGMQHRFDRSLIELGAVEGRERCLPVAIGEKGADEAGGVFERFEFIFRQGETFPQP